MAKMRDNGMEQLERVLSVRSSVMQLQSHRKDFGIQKLLVFERATFRDELSGCLYGSYVYICCSIPDKESQPTGQIGREKNTSKTYNIRSKSSVSLPVETNTDPDKEMAAREHKSWDN